MKRSPISAARLWLAAVSIAGCAFANGCKSDDAEPVEGSAGGVAGRGGGAGKGGAGSGGAVSGGGGSGGKAAAAGSGGTGADAGAEASGGASGADEGGAGGESGASDEAGAAGVAGIAGAGGDAGHAGGAGEGGDSQAGAAGETGGSVEPVPAGGERAVIWQEDFEDGTSDWTVEGNEWEFGVPLNGSNGASSPRPLAHSGTNVAGTGLTTNYANNRDDRLIGPAITIPAADTRPRLRYWYWDLFGSGDHGNLEIRVSGGEWQELERFEYDARVWTQQIVDLRAYAGLSVEFGFRLVSNDGTVSSGLFVDDLSVETGALPLTTPEGFETGYGNWSVEGGNWAIGVPFNGSNSGSSSRPLAATGDACASTGINSNYSLNQDARLISPEFVVPASEAQPTLRYSSWHSFGSGDSVQAQIRSVGGAWQNLPDSAFTGTDRNWTARSTNLRPYAGLLVQVGFRLISNNAGVSTGIFLDDISIQTE